MKKVLVVDDFESVRMAIKFILEHFGGYEIIEAETFEKAAELFKTHQHELNIVITDWNLGGQFNGGDVIRTIRGFSPRIPIILASSELGNPEIRALVFSGQICSFLMKPFGLNEMRLALHEAEHSNSELVR